MGVFRAWIDAIYREYDRRIKRASAITDYQQDQQSHSDDTAAESAPLQDEEDDAAIVNLPRGSAIK